MSTYAYTGNREVRDVSVAVFDVMPTLCEWKFI